VFKPIRARFDSEEFCIGAEFRLSARGAQDIMIDSI